MGHGAGLLPVVQAVAQAVGEDVGVLEGRGFHPAAGGLVADDQAQVVVLGAAVFQAFDVQAQAAAQLLDVGGFTGEQRPAGADAELFGVAFEGGGGVVVGVDADGVEEDVLADPVTEDLLYLAQTGGFHRAGVGAAGEDEVDGDHLVLDQVVEEMHFFAVLSEQGDVGEIAGPPGRGRCFGHRSLGLQRPERNAGGEQREYQQETP
ncbi:hypothetical protein D9M71_546540 [compost metagenome]